MRKWCNSPEFVLTVIVFFLVTSLISSLSGCSNGPGDKLSKALQVVGGSGTLPPDALSNFNRFKAVFDANSTTSTEARLDYFSFAYKRLRTSYVREVSDVKLIDAAIKGIENLKKNNSNPNQNDMIEAALDSMTASLDPHTSYLNPEEFKESFVQTKGEFGGLGIEVTMKDGFVKIVSPIADTPAFRAGLISGDFITHVDSSSIKGKSLREAVRLMRGRPGTKILLKIRRSGSPDFDVSITRAVIKVKPVRWSLKGDIGYIRISRFSERLESGIGEAINKLRDKLGQNPKGLIIDLRNNPGGLLDQSIILADSFMEKGEIVSIRGRNPKAVRSFKAKNGDLSNGVPMVVLINYGTASASEIVASALKHNGRATILGTPSYGKGSVQTIIPLLKEGALKVTTALYYGPDGKTIQARGVSPDIHLVAEKTIKSLKEVDLPGAISPQGAGKALEQFKVSETKCPEIGKNKDRELGCALAFLEHGRVKFLAEHSVGKKM